VTIYKCFVYFRNFVQPQTQRVSSPKNEN